MAKIKNLEKVIPDPVVAAAWVEPEDTVKKKIIQGLRASAGKAFDADLGNTALVAVADGLWIVPVKPGLASIQAQDGGVKLERASIKDFRIEKALANLPVIIERDDGDRWEFRVHKARRKDLEKVISALGF